MSSENWNKTGLISFLCWVLHDGDTNERFHGDEGEAMGQFDLSHNEQLALRAIGGDRHEPEFSKNVETFLDEYLCKPFLEIWTATVTTSVSAPPRVKGRWISFMYYARHDSETNKRLRTFPSKALQDFGIIDAHALEQIQIIATNQGKGAEAEAAARSIFKNSHLVDEVTGTEPRPFW